jgi:hypothetical protein
MKELRFDVGTDSEQSSRLLGQKLEHFTIITTSKTLAGTGIKVDYASVST